MCKKNSNAYVRQRAVKTLSHVSDHITSVEGTPARGNEGQENDCYIRMSKDRSNSKL